MKNIANIMKPTSLKEITGQQHIVGQGKILNNLINEKQIISFILHGKPGMGKNSIADALIKDLDLHHRYFNAAINTKKDLDIIFEEAKLYKDLVIVIDEFHRLNKAKQDLFLEYIESNLIKVIILTSENPYRVINPAIRSRCIILELKELTYQDILKKLQEVIDKNILKDIKIDTESLTLISKLASGDLRYAYNLLESLYYYNDNHLIDTKLIEDNNIKANLYIDNNEAGHYDLLSALQKSIRGSHVQASLYYLACLLTKGDLEIILRRLTVIAYEDIGLANPNMGIKIAAARDNCLFVGLEEARIILSQIVIEMALSPKSNSSYMAINKVLEDIRNGNYYDVNNNIKINTRTYIYEHDYPNNIVNQEYLPKELSNVEYYHPKHIAYEENYYKNFNIINKLRKEKH